MMSDMDNDLDAVVIDNGTWMVKAGFAGDKTARAYVRTMIGTDNVSHSFTLLHDCLCYTLFYY